MDPSKIRPKVGWVLVLADQRKAKVGMIEVPVETGVEKVTEGAGTVIGVGRGEKNAACGLEKGVRIVYRGYLKEANKIDHDEKWENGEGKVYFFMDSDDIMGLVPPGVEVGIFSGRPQVPNVPVAKK